MCTYSYIHSSYLLLHTSIVNSLVIYIHVLSQLGSHDPYVADLMHFDWLLMLGVELGKWQILGDHNNIHIVKWISREIFKAIKAFPYHGQ